MILFHTLILNGIALEVHTYKKINNSSSLKLTCEAVNTENVEHFHKIVYVRWILSHHFVTKKHICMFRHFLCEGMKFSTAFSPNISAYSRYFPSKWTSMKVKQFKWKFSWNSFRLKTNLCIIGIFFHIFDEPIRWSITERKEIESEHQIKLSLPCFPDVWKWVKCFRFYWKSELCKLSSCFNLFFLSWKSVCAVFHFFYVYCRLDTVQKCFQ